MRGEGLSQSRPDLPSFHLCHDLQQASEPESSIGYRSLLLARKVACKSTFIALKSSPPGAHCFVWKHHACASQTGQLDGAGRLRARGTFRWDRGPGIVIGPQLLVPNTTAWDGPSGPGIL